MRAEKRRRLVRKMRRDLSYETDSGLRTKTVETWDLASCSFRHSLTTGVVLSLRIMFLSSYFINLVQPVENRSRPMRTTMQV